MIRSDSKYKATFAEDGFKLFEEAKTAGYYISKQEITPIKVELVSDPLGKILAEKVELRFSPDLYPIRDKVILSSLDFSIIRFRNAKGP